METIKNLYEKMEEQLKSIELESGTIVERAKRSVQVVDAVMKELKDYIVGYEFKDAGEEIYFFKELKPKFYWQLIYFLKLFEIETHLPAGSVKSRKKFLRRKMGLIQRFFEDNINFYQYYRSKATYLDDQYFVRNQFDLLKGLDTNYFDCDPNFCSGHDYKVAMLMANEQLINYLTKVISQLEPVSDGQKHTVLKELELCWADTKVGMIELLYGLQSMGVFINAQTRQVADLKQVTHFFEVLFGIDLGNYYRTFQEIRIRKKGRTVFIDRLREKLIDRMDNSDGNYRA